MTPNKVIILFRYRKKREKLIEKYTYSGVYK
jgi:hypothetical protein